MKKILTVLLLLPMLVMGQNPKPIKPVATHTVAAKESLSSIGRLYEVNGRVLANYNGIDYDKGLFVGQVLKIPPKGTTIDQVPPAVNPAPVVKEEGQKNPQKIMPGEKGQAVAPVYHKVEKKETLYHISTVYKVSVEDLKKWNSLSSDEVTEGTSLIVGFEGVAPETKTVAVEKEKKPAVQEEKKEQPKPVKEAEVADTKPMNRDTKDGTFKTIFESQSNGEQVKQEGTAGVFKSTSGWTDGKYYCLHNNATPGTIIRITNAANGRSVFAKVLDAMPDIKQNSGLLICVSNAAAKELGSDETNFNCSINYSK